MREATRGKLTSDQYIYQALRQQTYINARGKIPPTKCLKGCSLVTLKQEKGLGFILGYLKDMVIKIT